MSKRHPVTLHHIITVYSDMFDHMDGVMQTLAKKMTQWKEDIFFAVKCAQQRLSKYYTELTPTTGMLRISAVTREESTPRYTQLEVSLSELRSGAESNQSRINVE